MAKSQQSRDPTSCPEPASPTSEPIVLGDRDLSLKDVVYVSRYRCPVRLTGDTEVRRRVDGAFQYIQKACERGDHIYGVTTGFGGMSNVPISSADASELQTNLIWFLKAGAGKYLAAEDVRAAMLVRANSFLRGASGLRWEIIERLVAFLNKGVIPRVRELGSIGASGDLVPLASIAGALIGADLLSNDQKPGFLEKPGFSDQGRDVLFPVEYQGQVMGARAVLKSLGLPPLQLQPKEGLALVNGTSMSAGMAANCMYDAWLLLALTLGAHALIIQGLRGSAESFHPFVHKSKGHRGQMWVADVMNGLLEGSKMLLTEEESRSTFDKGELFQDRYSLRCLAQFMGPVIEGMQHSTRQIVAEINSVNDNPVIDLEHESVYHCGNFLGQYIGVAMDQLRYYLSLLAKHLDAQIALLVEPLFSNGLPASLVGNTGRKVNMGLKGLQISGNSIMPMISFLANSIADRFPTHAEQFNQNVNSQSFGSANLARQSIELFRQYISIGLMFGVQAVDLRTRKILGHHDARESLSPATKCLYEAVREVVGTPPDRNRSYIWDDNEQGLDEHIERIVQDISRDGKIRGAIMRIRAAVEEQGLDISM